MTTSAILQRIAESKVGANVMGEAQLAARLPNPQGAGGQGRGGKG
jgi:hypothetical protein